MEPTPSTPKTRPATSPATIADIRLEHSTDAVSLWEGPLGAGATAISQTGLNGLQIEPIKRERTEDPLPQLDLTWDLEDFEVNTQALGSFAVIQQVVTVSQQPLDDGSADASQDPVAASVRLTTLSRDGKTPVSVIETPDARTVKHGSLTTENEGAPTLAPGVPKALSVEMPLDPNPRVVNIAVSHLEYSAEIARTAAKRVASQVGSDQGRSGTDARMYWDMEEKRLTFDALPLNVISDTSAKEIADRYRDDPLAGGRLEIDPFFYVGEPDGDGYFVGEGGVRLVDKRGRVMFEAALPGLVYENDEEVFPVDGYQLLGPVVKTRSIQGYESPWLDAVDKHLPSELFNLPELLVGFHAPLLGPEPWRSSFSVIPDAVVSFTGPAPARSRVPLVNTALLLALGLVTLAVSAGRPVRHRRCGGHRPCGATVR